MRRIVPTLIALAVAVAALIPATADARRSPHKHRPPRATMSGTAVTWPPPELTDPITVQVSPTNRILRLAAGQDYIIKMPAGPLYGANGLSISGGRNVVMIGGQIDISGLGAAGLGNAGRGLILAGQTGTVHIEGLRMTGDSLDEGINLSEGQGAIVQLQNIRIDGLHSPEEPLFTSFHPDLIQTWAGPAELRIDRFTGTTDYQGFFLTPAAATTAPLPRIMDLRNVQITGTSTSAYLLWRSLGFPVALNNIWVDSQAGRAPWQLLYPTVLDWPGVNIGRPKADIVPTWKAGPTYISSGYTS